MIDRLPPPWAPALWVARSFPISAVLRLCLLSVEFVERTLRTAVDGAPAERADPTSEREQQPTPVREGMQALLRRSLEQSTDAAEAELFGTLLGQLVADEARILMTLHEAGPAPMLDVESRSLGPGNGKPLLRNASLVGRTAAVTIPSLTSVYVTRLERFGLVEDGPEDPALATDYEVLMAEAVVRDALAGAAENGFFPPKVQRRTLRISALGRDLCNAARQPQPAPSTSPPAAAPSSPR